MLSSPGRYLALLFLCAALALPLRSEETPAAKQPAPTKTKDAEKKADKKSASTPTPPADGKKPSDLKKWDPSTLPADAVVLVCERIADALQMVPNAVILTPAKYLEMRDEIERLRKALQTDKPVTPTTCQLKGKVEEGAVLLEAVFEGSTDRPNTVVALACPRAGAAPAQNAEGGQIIRRTESGFLAEIEKPGKYQLKLDLFVPLTPRDNGRGFELTLPRATFTRLDLDLPANSKDVRVGGKTLSDPDLSGLTLKGHHLSGTPSTRPVEKLDVAWKEVRPPSGVPVLTADGRIQVRLDPSGLTTEADLVLRIEGAPTNVWRLLVPVGAEVQVTPSDDARARTTTIETDKQKYKFAWLRTIHLKEPSAEPLQVHIKAHAPQPRGGLLVPVGPFFVLGAARQTGTVEVKNQVRHLHLYYHGHGDMILRKVEEGTGGDTTAEVAKFTYGDIPKVENPKEATGASSLSWLDLQVEPVRAQVRTRVIHTLTLRPDSTHEALHWDILTTITPVSKWPDIEQLKILVPPNWISTDDGIPVTEDKNARFVTYRSSVLPRDGSAQKLQGRYDLPSNAEDSATLQLPRPLGFVEQCEVKIKAPADSEVLLHNAAQADLELISQPRPNEQTWHCRQVLPPAWPGLKLSWGPYQPVLPATSVVDLTLNGKRADIRHEIRLQLPQTPPASFSLRLPAALGDTLPQIEPEEKLQPWHDASATPKGIVRFSVPTTAGGTECRLVLNYTIPLGGDEGKPPGPGQQFTVPLVVPEQTRGAIKVRVWSGLNSLPLPLPGSAWEERSIEEVKERQDLPVLVLQAPRSDAPLVLRCGESSSVFTALVERALVRVQLREDGEQIYRASFLLRQLADQHLDIKLPGSVETLKVHIALNHHSVMPDILNEQGQPARGGDVARLSLGPDLIRRLALLEVSYQLSGRGGGRLRSTLQPPQLRGAPPTVPTRWLVTLPSHRVLIAPENAAGLEHTWTRRGWLLAARLNRTGADIEREFEEPLPAELHQDERSESDASAVPTLVCWQDSVEPFTLTHAPQQAWLLVCSLGLLVLGLGLYWTARPRPGEGGHMAPWLWPILALLTLGVVVGALFWPTILWAVVYGCEPGALVLACVIAFQWLMHQRYRRQIVFLPSFSRGRSGSSLLRKSGSSRPRTGEPSTVDAPPPSVG
ncbi:MAG TPA: hypothetical protein VH682_07835 [Gemmataceae bacterium]|jgi:hypothetical protein